MMVLYTFFVGCDWVKTKKYIIISSDSAVEQKIKDRWNPNRKGFGVIVGAYDTTGFHKTKGYVQHTLSSILFFLVMVMYTIVIGVYPDPSMSPTITRENQ